MIRSPDSNLTITLVLCYFIPCVIFISMFLYVNVVTAICLYLDSANPQLHAVTYPISVCEHFPIQPKKNWSPYNGASIPCNDQLCSLVPLLSLERN
jgi:hypothetical protein